MSEGTRTAVERADVDQGSVLARFKAQMWQQEDLALSQSLTGPRAGINAFERTRAWKHARGGELSAPALHEGKRWTFEQIAPEPIPPDVGPPEPIDQGTLRFATRRPRRDQQRTATMMWTMGEAGFDEAVLGQEVDRLYQWMQTQRATIGPITELEPLMRTLQRNGILDDDLQVADEAHLEALLRDVARSGRVDAYASDGPSVSADVLDATRQVAECDANVHSQIAHMDKLKAQISGLQSDIRATRFEVKAFFERRAQQAAEREAASLLREKTQALAWIDAFASAVGGWATAFKGMASASSVGGKLDAGAGATGLVSAAGKLVVNLVYEEQIDEAFSRVSALRARAEAAEASRLTTKLDGLAEMMKAFVETTAKLEEATASYKTSRARAYASLGSTLADALPRMGPRSKSDGAVRGAIRDREVDGRVQMLFASIPQYEEISARAGRIGWPRLTGDIPMSGFLFWSENAATLADIAEEAAKLRWWKARTSGVAALLGRVRRAIEAAGDPASSR